MVGPEDETQPVQRVSPGDTQEIPQQRPEKGHGSAWEPAPGTRARHRGSRRSVAPSRPGAGYAWPLRCLRRAAAAPGAVARALADRWDDIWPPMVGIFFGCLAGGSALVLIFTVAFRYFW